MKCFRNNLVHRFWNSRFMCHLFSHFWLLSFWVNMNNHVESTQSNKWYEGVASNCGWSSVQRLLPGGPTWGWFTSPCPSLLCLSTQGPSLLPEQPMDSCGPRGHRHRFLLQRHSWLVWRLQEPWQRTQWSSSYLEPSLDSLIHSKVASLLWNRSVHPRGRVWDKANFMGFFVCCLIYFVLMRYSQYEVKPCSGEFHTSSGGKSFHEEHTFTLGLESHICRCFSWKSTCIKLDPLCFLRFIKYWAHTQFQDQRKQRPARMFCNFWAHNLIFLSRTIFIYPNT